MHEHDGDPDKHVVDLLDGLVDTRHHLIDAVVHRSDILRRVPVQS